MEFYASCPEGFEAALADEMRALGLEHVRRLKGRVTFDGEPAAAYRACLWSRLASRVFAVLARFEAQTADELYAAAYDIPWEEILADGASFAITARGVTDELRNTQFSALRVKDAICDRLVDQTGRRPNVDAAEPDAHLVLSLRQRRASLNLDLSGEPLFKRLPPQATRATKGPAAHVLRPDYAALLLAQTGWAQACAAPTDPEDYETDARPVLIDASCAGGGVLLEAVNMLLDRAPGANRERWGFEGWKRHDADAWQRLLDEAREREEAARGRRARIVAADSDGTSRKYAEFIVKCAGYKRFVSFCAAKSATIVSHAGVMKSVAIVADTTETSVGKAHNTLTMLSELRTASELSQAPFAALTRDALLARAFHAEPAVELAVKPNNEEAAIVAFASPDETTKYTTEDAAPGKATHTDGERTARKVTQAAAIYAGDDDADAKSSAKKGPRGKHANDATPSAPQPVTSIDLGDGQPVPLLVPESAQFANRLKKNARRLRKWAKREDVSCYRVYDADLPDYAAAIDLFVGSDRTPGRWLVIAEYAAPKTVDAATAQARMLDILAIAPRVLAVEPQNVHAKTRMQSRGGSQYAKKDAGNTGNGRGGERANIARRKLPLIEEGGLTFALNFDDYLDVGIFLDHRVTRGLVREHAKRARRFLNLFAYTGTATCYAADGGVEETVTVDLSNTYLDWAEKNMQLNGFTGPEHHFVRADVLQWIRDQRQTIHRWDLIFVDPPTFSNSSKMGTRTWDVQRDHVELLIGVSRLLSLEGHAIFSCNLRGFRPEARKLALAGVVLRDITPETIPEDFARNKKIHHCYIVDRMPIEDAMAEAGFSRDEIAERTAELQARKEAANKQGKSGEVVRTAKPAKSARPTKPANGGSSAPYKHGKRPR